MVEKKEKEFQDHIGYKQDTDILATLDKHKAGKLHLEISFLNIEKIIFSCKVIKYNRFGMK